MKRNTTVSIRGDDFLINGTLTYPGVAFRGMRVEGLLMNSRMVQGTFDDRNPETRPKWDRPGVQWDAARNTREFVAAMDAWRAHGLLALTLNFQGGSPQGYSKEQPWHNSAFESDGSLRDDYLARMKSIIDRADELGMVIILGLFYFGQEHRLESQVAVVRAVENAVDWLLEIRYKNVLIEIGNEVDHPRYRHHLMRAHRCHDLIRMVQERSKERVDSPSRRLLAGTSLCGGKVPGKNLCEASDFLLMHGNGVKEPDRIRAMVDEARAVSTYRGQPILFNEDDHFDFDAADNNMLAAVSRHASWGYFDWRMPGERFEDGYQSVPVDWGINSERKRGFFGLLKRMTRSQIACNT